MASWMWVSRLAISFMISFANELQCVWSHLQVSLFYGPWFARMVASHQRQLSAVDAEILSYNDLCSGILKDNGSLLLQVTLYKIFSILCASSCQIRLIWNTIIKRTASHASHWKPVVFKRCIRTWKAQITSSHSPSSPSSPEYCKESLPGPIPWGKFSGREGGILVFLKFYLRPHLKNGNHL